jgi:hypothetical protein
MANSVHLGMTLDAQRLKVPFSIVIAASVAMMNVHQHLMSCQVHPTALALPFDLDLVCFTDLWPVVRVVTFTPAEKLHHRAV